MSHKWVVVVREAKETKAKSASIGLYSQLWNGLWQEDQKFKATLGDTESLKRTAVY